MRRSTWLGFAAVFLTLPFVFALVLMVLLNTNLFPEPLPWGRPILVIPLLCPIGAVASMVMAGRGGWRRHEKDRSAKPHT